MKTEVETLCDLRKETCSPQDCRGVYVGLEHIDAGSFVLARHGTPSQVRSAKSRFYPGDVLYGKLRPYLDKAIVAEVEGICSTDILVLEPCGAPSWFLCGVLHTNRFIEHAKKTTQGVNHPRTSWSGIKDFETTAFPVSEQKKIAAVLLKIQQAVEMQEKIIQSLLDLKKSTMQHLFTHGLRGEIGLFLRRVLLLPEALTTAPAWPGQSAPGASVPAWAETGKPPPGRITTPSIQAGLFAPARKAFLNNFTQRDDKGPQMAVRAGLAPACACPVE